MATTGRFSKLETGASAGAGADDELRARASLRGADGENVTSPDYDQGHYQKEAERFFYQGDFKNALRRYSRAMQVDHSSVDPWIGQILALVQMKQNREATMWVLRALELFPEEARLISLQGLTMALTGSQQRAMSCSDYAMTLQGPHTPFVWAMRAQVLSRSENPNAGFCFDKILETRRPDDWQIAALTGMFLMQSKRWSRALEFLRLSIDGQPRNSYLWNQIGKAAENLGMTQAAIEAYNVSLEQNQNDAEARTGLERITRTSLPVRLWRRFFARKQ